MMPDNSNTQEKLEEPQVSAKKVFPLVLLVILAGIIILIASVLQSTIGLKNTLIVATNFLSAPVEKVASENGRTNILVMGKAGGTHDGADLTDTMIVASISLTKPSVSLVSIPRDLWIPEIRAKVNSAYYWGKQRDEGGIPFAKSIVGKVVGVPIQYGIVMEGFSAFENAVDAVGGIEVNVERGFTDKLYPIAGKEKDLCGGDPKFACRYETITFNAGSQVMNGETALKFGRSRMAEGEEGTDQAREARTQLVITAIKNKLLSPEVFLNPRRILAVFNVIKSSIETDIDVPVASVIARKFFDSRDAINQHLIPGELLINPPISKTYDNQYVFIPKPGNGNWKEINTWILTTMR